MIHNRLVDAGVTFQNLLHSVGLVRDRWCAWALHVDEQDRQLVDAYPERLSKSRSVPRLGIGIGTLPPAHRHGINTKQFGQAFLAESHGFAPLG
ncbi:hypothetical protein Rhe02_47210 [Rhizocola hellebori]|uniref:Uncharacterized protein n=1 Tax=Rhizocola hellebori TaxID=1392758 RepID=A0A8J3VGR9_9ACTN|nr:hypothetical protein Rhe02_47210 [Rhizocola hellebori]